MKSFTKKLCIVNVIFYLFYPPPEVPPTSTPGTPPLGGDFTTFLENRPPYTRRKDQYRGKLTPPGRSSGDPPGGGLKGGGVKSRKTLGISAKTYRDPSLFAMFSWFLIPFSGYPPPPTCQILGSWGGERAPSVSKMYFYADRT